MSYKTDITIKKLSLMIPIEDLGLRKIDNELINTPNPTLKLQKDECDWKEEKFKKVDGYFKIELKDYYCIDTYGWFGELEALVIKYKGILEAEADGEETGDYEKIKIINGQKKKFKLVETD